MFYIRGRKTWGANPPHDTPTRDNWSAGVTLVVHHTAGHYPRTAAEERAEMRFTQSLHFGNGWNDIGYNYLIAPSGRVYEGRGFGIRGAHTAMHNTGTIGVSFMGNYQTRKPNRRQMLAYRLLIRRLRLKGARITKITGHKFMPDQATACPGKYLIAALGLK